MTVRKSPVAVDTHEGAWEGWWAVLIACSGAFGSDLPSPREIRRFKSGSFAPGDAVSARHADERAIAAGRGAEVTL